MINSKELAAEWQRISRAKDDIRNALVEHGVAIPREARIDEFAPAIRGYTPSSISIYKRGMFERSPQSRLPNMSVSPAYSPADMSLTFSSCKSLLAIPIVDGLDTASSIAHYAYGCSLVSGNFSLPNLPICTAMNSSFEGCLAIERLSVGAAPECTNIRSFANGCRSLVEVKMGDMPKLTFLGQAFINCQELVRVEMSIGSSATEVGNMFYGCISLREIVGVLDVSSIPSFSGAFSDCRALEEVRIKGLKVDIALQWSQNISIESVKYLVDNLQQSTGKTITLPASWRAAHPSEAKDYAKIAAMKGFSLSFR